MNLTEDDIWTSVNLVASNLRSDGYHVVDDTAAVAGLIGVLLPQLRSTAQPAKAMAAIWVETTVGPLFSVMRGNARTPDSGEAELSARAVVAAALWKRFEEVRRGFVILQLAPMMCDCAIAETYDEVVDACRAGIRLRLTSVPELLDDQPSVTPYELVGALERHAQHVDRIARATEAVGKLKLIVANLPAETFAQWLLPRRRAAEITDSSASFSTAAPAELTELGRLIGAERGGLEAVRNALNVLHFGSDASSTASVVVRLGDEPNQLGHVCSTIGEAGINIEDVNLRRVVGSEWVLAEIEVQRPQLLHALEVLNDHAFMVLNDPTENPR